MIPLTSKELTALYLLEKGLDHQNYFFSRLASRRLFPEILKRGYFDATKNPKPTKDKIHDHLVTARWPALDYLVTLAKQPNSPLAGDILKIIRDITLPETFEQIDNFFTWAQLAEAFANLPTNVISIGDFDLVKRWLNWDTDSGIIVTTLSKTLLPKLLMSDRHEDQRKLCALVDAITPITWREEKSFGRNNKVAEMRTDPYWIGPLFNDHASELAKMAGKAIINNLSEKLCQVLEGENNDGYTYIWRPQIERPDNPQRRNVKGALISAIRDILNNLVPNSIDDAKTIVDDFIRHKYLTFRRIAVHTINQHFVFLKDVFFRNLTTDLFRSEMRHELYLLFKNQFPIFEINKKKLLIDLIDNLKAPNLEDADAVKRTAHLRAQWIHAIKDLGFDEADKLYKQYTTELGFEPYDPSTVSKVQAGSVRDESPIRAEDLAKMPIEETIRFFKDFKPDSKDPFVDQQAGLANALRTAVQANPSHFDGNLEAFSNLPGQYVHSLIHGYQDRWVKSKDIVWPMVLKFFQYLLDSNFFSDKDERANYRGSIISAMCELIEKGTQSDETAFSKDLLPLADQILRHVKRITPLEININPDDAFNNAINRPRGNLLEALLNLSLRYTRIQENGAYRATVWSRLKPLFEDELRQCVDNNLEFSAMAAHYLPNLLYLDKDWLVENIKAIFPITYPRNWIAALDGLSYSPVVYDDIYRLLRSNEIYLNAVSFEFSNQRIRERIIQHIGIAYLRDNEDLDSPDSLIQLILEKWDYRQLIILIDFFSDAEKQFADKVLRFWGKCYDKVLNEESENRLILSHLSSLSCFLENITPLQKRWLEQCSPYVEDAYHAPDFLKQIRRLSSYEKNKKAIADVLIKMVARVQPNYQLEDIRSTVESLYASGFKDEANIIANAYKDLMRDIIDKYNTRR